MGIKDFLKPTIRKTILTLIILFLLSWFAFPYIYESYPEFCIAEKPCEPVAVSIIIIDFYIDVTNFNEVLRSIIFSLFILGEVISSYIISCLIIYSYYKIKRNKNKRKK